jgi:hypothetical protein
VLGLSGTSNLSISLGSTYPVDRVVSIMSETDTLSSTARTLSFNWGPICGTEVFQNVEKVYDHVVFWRRNFFPIPNNSSGRAFVSEITNLLNAFAERSPLECITMKAIAIIFHLLLQRSHRKSSTQENKANLSRRIELWKSGEIMTLFREARTLQKTFSSHKFNNQSTNDIARQFNQMMLLGNVNAAMRFLTDNSRGGIHSLNPHVLNILHQKHPRGESVNDETILSGCMEDVHPIRFDGITGDTIRQSAIHTRGAAGPSGAHADQWKHICTGFRDISSNLCNAIAGVARRLASDIVNPKSLEAFLANRLIPLDKCPGVRPIGIGEVLRRIIGKTIVRFLKEDIQIAAGPLQLCTGLKAGCETAIHSVSTLFQNSDCEAVLLVDADNAFNRLNRKVALQNIRLICPYLYTYTTNCYQTSSKLFVSGGATLNSEEGTTQGDPLAMPLYALSMVPLLNALRGPSHQIWYADDAQATGKLESLRQWWNIIVEKGHGYGYFANAAKSILVVKSCHLVDAERIFDGTNIKITNGARDLGAAIGDENFVNNYVNEKVSQFCQNMELLSEIAVQYPQAALSAYVHGMRHRWCFIQRTIPVQSNAFAPLEEIIRLKFIAALLGGHIVSDDERLLLSLPGRYGGLSIDNPMETCEFNFKASSRLSEHLKQQLLNQSTVLKTDTSEEQQCKSFIRKEQDIIYSARTTQLASSLPQERVRAMMAAQQKGASFIVTTLPVKKFGFALSKREFRDQILLRYRWPIPNLQLSCACGSPYSVDHSQVCHLGGFINQRHDEIRDIFAAEIKNGWVDVETEPNLLPLSGETVLPQSAIRDDNARADIRVRGFWNREQNAFFDVNVFYPHASSYLSKSLPEIFRQNENQKVRQYQDRIINIEHGSFTPLIFSSTGGMGKYATRALRKIANATAEKKKEPVSLVMGLLRCRISFALMRAASTCLRGTRTRRFHPSANVATEVITNHATIH